MAWLVLYSIKIRERYNTYQVFVNESSQFNKKARAYYFLSLLLLVSFCKQNLNPKIAQLK
jgi:hypothetical protein